MKKNINRFLGIAVAVVLVVLTLIVITNFNWSWAWWGSAIATLITVLWFQNGSTTVEVGWEGLLLCIGERIDPPVTMGEGWHWVPFPFSLKLADCRETSVAIDPLTVLTADNIQVEISGTLVSKIMDLNKYFNVDPATIKQGIDDTWDEIIRTQVVVEEFEAVRKMHVAVGDKAKAALENQATSAWGIKVIRIPVTIKVKTEEVAADLELQAREKLQKKGQTTEAENFIALEAINIALANALGRILSGDKMRPF
ncbi:MAG: SPFH domain-containing protein [bacterium]